ncbi:MAG: aminotransferase class III-fold pyridoxal phosphate-dependent enzyme [Candidatus Heimdallarchaeota archaeon]|nr:MAG: aminotransferase class III-fold pyridoxal phosphate-dependent enzyme [Candidatus Heimdallarchaeota archaeon]
MAESNAEGILKNNLQYTLFSWSKQAGLNPINAERAEGCYVYTHEGKKYLDFCSQLFNVNLGHSHPKVLAAMKKQLEKLCYVYPGMATEPRGLLGKKLAEITPKNLTKTFFTLGGAEAVENAIKVARMYSGRHKIITRYRSYHGATMGAISAGGDPRRHPVDQNAMPGIVHVEDPYCYRCPWTKTISSCDYECVKHIERVILFENPENIAAILMEGESGTSGCIKYPPEYWQRIKKIAEKHRILLISDEVMSGFGRCGNWFAIQNSGVEPDMICMAKGITSAYIPLGALIVSNEIAEFFNEHTMNIGLTQSAYALGCATALACLQVYEEEKLIENTWNMGKYLEDQIEVLKRRHICIGDFRNTGLLGCLELVKNRETKEPLVPWNCKPSEMGVMAKIIKKIRDLGMYTFVKWNWIFIAPPLNVTKDDIDNGLAIISKALILADDVCKGE